jgi:hypothetical protein
MREILLSQGKFAIVDDADYGGLSQYNWFFNKIGYAVKNEPREKRYKNCRKTYMHRLILNTEKGIETDHINGNTLDNRRCNLRLATKSQNAMNVKSKGGTSKYKGVHFSTRKNKWIAQIVSDCKHHYIGEYFLEIEAAIAYNNMSQKLHGKFAKLNEITYAS